MEIQNSAQNIESRRARLFKSAMVYIILFSIGIVIYIGASKDSGQQTLFDKILGIYNAGTSSSTVTDTPPPKEQILADLDKFNTLKTDAGANLPSCQNIVTDANYPSDSHCTSDACKAVAKDGALSGWVSLTLCNNGKQPNQNLGCKTDTFVGTTVETMAVTNIPVLGFIADTTVKTSKDTNSKDPYTYTQPPCFYNMFRNPFNSSDLTNPLSFSFNKTTDIGPVFMLSNTQKLAVIPYPSLASGSQCWGFNPDNFTDTAHFDIKAFLDKYRGTDNPAKTPKEGSTSLIDTWWSLLIDYFKSKFDIAIAKNPKITEKVSEEKTLPNLASLCDDLPGGPVVKLNISKEVKPATTDASYEITRKVYEFTKYQMCSMMYQSDILTSTGTMSCVLNNNGGVPLTITNNGDNRGVIFNPWKYRQELRYTTAPTPTPYYVTVQYCDEKPMCGVNWGCPTSNGDVYNYCMQNPSNVLDFAGTGIKFKVSTDSFPTMNFPNGMKLLRDAYDLLQNIAPAPYAVKIGDNIGIKVDAARTLLDANAYGSNQTPCSGNCTYGQNILYRPNDLNYDPTVLVDSSVKQYISVEKNQPYSVAYIPGSVPAATVAVAAGGNVPGVSSSKLSYIFPYLGNLPQMYEMISTFLTNPSNEDTGSTLVNWLFGLAPKPLNNAVLGDVVIKLCQDESMTPQRNDCLDQNQSYMLADFVKKDYPNYPTNTPAPSYGGVVNPSGGVNPTFPDITFPPVTQIPISFSGFGIDIYDGTGTVDWAKVKADPQNVQFVLIKASEGDYNVQHNFVSYWNGAGGVGLKRSSWQYFRGAIDGKKQADLFIKTITDAGITPKDLDAPLSIDVEPYENEGVDPGVLTNNLKLMIDEMMLKGFTPMIYTGLPWNSMTTKPSWANQFQLWLAQWINPASNPNTAKPFSLPGNWTTYSVWQFSGDSSGSFHTYVNGINGIVDGDKIFSSAQQITAINLNNNGVLGVSTNANRSTDIDSLGTYLLADLAIENYTGLYTADQIPDSTTPYFPPGPTTPGLSTTPGTTLPNVTYPPITLQPGACITAHTYAECQQIVNSLIAQFPQFTHVGSLKCDGGTGPGQSIPIYNGCYAGNAGSISCGQGALNLGIITSKLLFHEIMHRARYSVISYAGNGTSEMQAALLENYYFPSTCSGGGYVFKDINDKKRNANESMILFMSGAGVSIDDMWKFTLGQQDTLSPVIGKVIPGATKVTDLNGHGQCYACGSV